MRKPPPTQKSPWIPAPQPPRIPPLVTVVQCISPVTTTRVGNVLLCHPISLKVRSMENPRNLSPLQNHQPPLPPPSRGKSGDLLGPEEVGAPALEEPKVFLLHLHPLKNQPLQMSRQ